MPYIVRWLIMVAVGVGGLYGVWQFWENAAPECNANCSNIFGHLFLTAIVFIIWGVVFIITMGWASEASGMSFDDQKRTLRSMQHRCPNCSKKLPKAYGVKKCPHCTADL